MDPTKSGITTSASPSDYQQLNKDPTNSSLNSLYLRHATRLSRAQQKPTQLAGAVQFSSACLVQAPETPRPAGAERHERVGRARWPDNSNPPAGVPAATPSGHFEQHFVPRGPHGSLLKAYCIDEITKVAKDSAEMLSMLRWIWISVSFAWQKPAWRKVLHLNLMSLRSYAKPESEQKHVDASTPAKKILGCHFEPCPSHKDPPRLGDSNHPRPGIPGPLFEIDLYPYGLFQVWHRIPSTSSISQDPRTARDARVRGTSGFHT